MRPLCIRSVACQPASLQHIELSTFHALVCCPASDIAPQVSAQGHVAHVGSVLLALERKCLEAADIVLYRLSGSGTSVISPDHQTQMMMMIMMMLNLYR